MEFACRKIDLGQIIKCSLGLTRAEYRIFQQYLKLNKEASLQELSEKTKLDRTTIQKASKKLLQKGLLSRSQKNREKGGYEYLYKIAKKQEIREKVRSIIRSWWENFDSSMEHW